MKKSVVFWIYMIIVFSFVYSCASGTEYSEEGKLLFGQPTYSSSESFSTCRFEELVLENNLWNSQNLAPGSYSQSIYLYQNDTALLFGWKWSFPAGAYSVNAYPEVIYGWKPWQESSTTSDLPVRIDDITKLKVAYDSEMKVYTGNYNLAFDNWIGETSVSDPANLRFEFMIWETRSGLQPFGNYKGTVSTSNGDYRFYTGEPDWEPEGSDWTYLAFVRTQGRTSGLVDIDELLDYLTGEGIVPVDNYLYSIEFGNEVCNSKGYNIMKEFRVELE